MKKGLFLLIALVFVAWGSVFAQDKAPSYFEMDDYNHRYPETDTQIDMWLVHWQQNPVYGESAGHGGWIERPYFTQGDPVNPPREGAVLKYMAYYNHGKLHPGTRTQPTTHDNEQVFFYIVKGEGRVEAGGQSADIAQGSGVFIPAGLEYQFFCTCEDAFLEAVIVGEEISDDFEPLTEMRVGTYKDSMPRPGMHWAHIGRTIVSGMKWENPVGFSAVSVDAWDVAQPHMHGPGVEEIWCQVEGESLLIFGNQLRVQKPGMAFLIPPTFKIPHSTINASDDPIMFLYMGNRHDPRETRSMGGHIPDWKSKIYDKYDIEY